MNLTLSVQCVIFCHYAVKSLSDVNISTGLRDNILASLSLTEWLRKSSRVVDEGITNSSRALRVDILSYSSHWDELMTFNAFLRTRISKSSKSRLAIKSQS